MNRLKGALCYLSGPIEYAADNGINWRKTITEKLREFDIGILDPLDKPTDMAYENKDTREYLKHLVQCGKNALEEGQKGTAEIYWAELTKILKEIVQVDLRLTDKADFLIVYVDPTIYTCGTWFEVAHAFVQRKPVIILCPSGIHNVPLWLFGQGQWQMMFTSIDEVMEYIRHIDQDEKVDTLNRWKFMNFEKIYGKVLAC